jgi:FkbM family methyltransferase
MRVMKSPEFEKKFAKFALRVVNHPPLFLERTQNGELATLLGLMLSESIEHRIIVDVGANGIQGSNSYDLMRHFGWKGVLVEANPALLPRIHAAFDGLNYELIGTAVSDFTGVTKLYLGDADGTSTIQSWASARRDAVEVPVSRLPDILQAYGVPSSFGVLSIDAEGEDPKIVNDTIGAGWLPQWIILEAYKPERFSSVQDLKEISELVKEKYRLAGATAANVILRYAP